MKTKLLDAINEADAAMMRVVRLLQASGDDRWIAMLRLQSDFIAPVQNEEIAKAKAANADPGAYRSELPTKEVTSKGVRAPRSSTTCRNIPIYGHKDPRGPDNNIRIWVDKEGLLHIRMEKTNRCYRFRRCINVEGYVEVIAE